MKFVFIALALLVAGCAIHLGTTRNVIVMPAADAGNDLLVEEITK